MQFLFQFILCYGTKNMHFHLCKNPRNFASYEIVPNNGESEEGVWTILDKDCNLYDQNMIVCSANQCAIGKPFSVAINKVVVWLDQECSRSGIGGYYNPETRKLYFDDGFTCNGGSA